MQEPSIFTKIINGEIPSYKVYEDDRVIAILDINPVTEGHTLVIPKEQIDSLWNLDDDLYQYLMQVVKKVAYRHQEVLKPIRVGFSLDGFGVPHAHVHVFSLNEGFERAIMHHVEKGEQEPDHAALAAMAERLRF
jgi:histidine triad (HIT) family protein